MAGNVAGGLKAAAKNLARDPNFYATIGRKGGKNSSNGGFASPLSVCGCDYIEGYHKNARCAGHKGGSISRKNKLNQETN